MKRVNGYRDLDEYFKRILNRKTIDRDILEDKKIIRQEFGGANSMFWFKYFGVDVLFKHYRNEYNIFSELISEEIAKSLDLPNAQYDTATFEGRKGLITYDFKKEGYEYRCLGDYLDVYSAYLRLISTENENNTHGGYYLKDYNWSDRDYIITNLEDVWHALEHYLKYEKKLDASLVSELVEKLMLQITDYFGYQIISGNYDMHSGNIVIGIKNDLSDALVGPLFDNEDMFTLSGEIDYRFIDTPRLMVERGNLENHNTNLEMLEQYLNASSEFFVTRFKNMFNKINSDIIYNAIKSVEEKIEMEIPYDIKYNIVLEFETNLKDIEELLENKKRS